jgi:hypothetical protein
MELFSFMLHLPDKNSCDWEEAPDQGRVKVNELVGSIWLVIAHGPETAAM